MFFTRQMAAGSKRSVHAMLLALGSATLVFTQQRHQPRLLEAHSSRVEPKWQKLPNPSEKTTEKRSGASFPNAIVREDVDEKLLRLCAVSIRCMLGMCFLDRARAYAFGIYLGSQAVEDLVKSNGDLSSINKMPEPTVTGLAPFYPSGQYEGFRDGYIFQAGPSGLGYYKDSKSPKWQTTKLAAPVLIRLVMLHDVDGEHLAHGFDKTLKSRVVPAMKESKEELAQLTRFRTCLNRLDKIPKGSNLDLVRTETGLLSLMLNGEVLENFDALLIGWAAVDAFIGTKGHLHAEGKKELVESARSIYAVRPLAEFSQ